MKYKRILTIQDISCFGQCSLTVALPILSACGFETCILPSAVLSTHTAGFTGYTVRDMTDDMRDVLEHWQKEDICFDAFYTGYLGSIEQIETVIFAINTLGKKNALKFIDPAMADNGKLYPAFNLQYAQKMKQLCSQADIILPNITEACLLTDTPYCENYDEDFIVKLLKGLSKENTKAVVLTGVIYKEGTIGIAVYENGQYSYYEHRKINEGCHGTGDIYSSAFVGAYLNGKSTFDSAKIAADYTVECIEATQGDKNHWYGAKFEVAIPKLLEKLN